MARKASLIALAVLLFPLSLAAQGGRSAPKTALGKGSKVPPPVPVHLVLAPDGNEVRFIVKEQLVGFDLPNDAVGKSSAITGGIRLDGTGKVDSAGSTITVDLASLKSDRDRRDGFIKRRTLAVDSFPTASLTITEIRGLPAVLPSSGTLSLTLVGNFTVHGVTRPTTWEVSAVASGDSFAGKASTHVKFGDFNMTPPRVPIVLSVVDDILLEYDFHLVKRPPSAP
ncbi:MAG TPA: YceI family protein [Gemmatimonadales bacterium]|nr:YceI family protein [Gemmatimonadales bacterium]